MNRLNIVTGLYYLKALDLVKKFEPPILKPFQEPCIKSSLSFTFHLSPLPWPYWPATVVPAGLLWMIVTLLGWLSLCSLVLVTWYLCHSDT